MTADLLPKALLSPSAGRLQEGNGPLVCVGGCDETSSLLEQKCDFFMSII